MAASGTTRQWLAAVVGDHVGESRGSVQWSSPRLAPFLGLRPMEVADDPLRVQTFGLPETSATEAGRLRELIDALAETVSLDSPWETPGASELDAQTLDTWLNANTEDKLAVRFFKVLAPALFAAEAQTMSLLHFLFYMKSGGNLSRLIATTGGGQEL